MSFGFVFCGFLLFVFLVCVVDVYKKSIISLFIIIISFFYNLKINEEDNFFLFVFFC